MKITFSSVVLFRMLTVSSISSVIACSPILQATRLSRPVPEQPSIGLFTSAVRTVDNQALSGNDGPPMQVDAQLQPTGPLTLGSQWVFIVKNAPLYGPYTGSWVVKPAN